MRYTHFDMLPEKAFQPVGKRMTLEGGGGITKPLSTAASIGMGQSPMGAFGSTLGSQVMGDAFGGGGGGGGTGSAGGNLGGFPGIGTQNQTQILGPFAGVNPASPAYNIMQDNRFGMPAGAPSQPQTQQPQVGATLFNGTVTPNTIGPDGLPVGGGVQQGPRMFNPAMMPYMQEMVQQSDAMGAMPPRQVNPGPVPMGNPGKPAFNPSYPLANPGKPAFNPSFPRAQATNTFPGLPQNRPMGGPMGGLRGLAAMQRGRR